MQLTQDELNELAKIKDGFYMKPPLSRLESFVSKHNKPGKEAIKEAFNYIHTFMIDSQSDVGVIQQERFERGEVRDLKQAAKSIAGSMFPKMVVYTFLKNKEVGNIPSNIFITTKQTAIKRFGEDFIIHIDGETQKPDCDIVIYNEDNKKIIILSLKTSLRERAGQTYKWKLLLEIANSKDTELKKKYGISYNGKNMPIICFATVNFYNEINNPQQKGMFKFFDQAFIAKPNIDADFISNMSQLPEFIEKTIL